MSTDVTGRPLEYGVTLLCTFAEEIRTASGFVVPGVEGFTLHLRERKPETFKTALSAVAKLQRHTPKPTV